MVFMQILQDCSSYLKERISFRIYYFKIYFLKGDISKKKSFERHYYKRRFIKEIISIEYFIDSFQIGPFKKYNFKPLRRSSQDSSSSL